MPNILILYYVAHHPMRATAKAHLDSYRQYSGGRCFYINLAMQSLFCILNGIKFDLIIFDYLFFDSRWDRKAFLTAEARVCALENSLAPKIALVQDEFMNMDLVTDFVRRFSISHVFSLAAPSEWSNIYASLDFEKVRLHRVLPGYLDESIIPKIAKMEKQIPARSVDIGYRTAETWPSAGRFNRIKGNIAELIMNKAAAKGFVVDCKVGQEQFFLGEEWSRFLLKCKYTVSVEGGASILDRDGTLMEKTARYLKDHANADFDELERECFPGREGELTLRSISPKHLESCATRTCQILVEGDYNGILKAGEHYLELKKDFSNFEEILDTIKQDDLRIQIVDRAYRDVVQSGLYSYRNFVETILRPVLPTSCMESRGGGIIFLAYALTCFLDKLSFFWLAVYYATLRFSKKMLPGSVWIILKNTKIRMRRG